MDEFDFELPVGYRDDTGTLHRQGVMRLATAADEILPLRDPRVRAVPAYKVVLLLSRVVVRLGSLDHVNPSVIEGLFAKDLGYLQELYGRINGRTSGRVRVTCPSCATTFEADGRSGKSRPSRRIR